MELTTQQIVQLLCWIVALVCYIILIYFNNVLRKEIKYLEEVKKIYKHKLEVVETEKNLYKSKYLDLVYNLPQNKTTADYKQQIITDYTKNRLSFEQMARKYWLKGDTIRKALYRWGYKKIS